MLQILLQPNDRFSLAEQGQIAIEGGCQWLVLETAGLDTAVIRETASDLVALCRENGVILTFDGSVEAARELGIHGVLAHSAAEAAELRGTLGAEAIIGSVCLSASEMAQLEQNDIDYCVLPTEATQDIAAARTNGIIIPAVAMGDFTADDCRRLILEGFDGVCTGRKLFAQPDPVQAISALLDSISR